MRQIGERAIVAEREELDAPGYDLWILEESLPHEHPAVGDAQMGQAGAVEKPERLEQPAGDEHAAVGIAMLVVAELRLFQKRRKVGDERGAVGGGEESKVQAH